MDTANSKLEYAKFFGVLCFVAAVAAIHADWQGMSVMQYLESFMGVFFIVFALFKLYNLREFANGLRSYVTLENKPLSWGYIYPFIQIAFGLGYLFGLAGFVLNGLVFLWSAYGSYIVLLTIRQKGHKVHCVCLGNVIKLPLSTISFVEDFAMAQMALYMLLV